MKKFKYIINDFIDNFSLILLLVVEFTVVLLIISTISSIYKMSYIKKATLQTIKDSSVASLRITYVYGGEYKITDDKELFSKIEEDFYSLYDISSEAQLGYPTFVLVGDSNFIEDVNGYRYEKGYSYFGSETEIDSNNIRIKGIELGKKDLEKGANIYIKNAFKLDLDDKILMYLSYEDFSKVIPRINRDNLLHQGLFRNFNDSELKNLNEIVKGEGYSFELIDLSTIIEKRLQENNETILYYFIYLGSMILVFIICALMSLKYLIDKKSKEYIIHLLCGAQMKDIYYRILIYSTIIIAFIFLSLFMADIMIQYFVVDYQIVITLLTIVYLAMIIYPIYLIKNKNLLKNLRGDV
ncbi:MAG: hypothetical protein ACK5KQ_00400 [Anaerorhabdus sp.]